MATMSPVNNGTWEYGVCSLQSKPMKAKPHDNYTAFGEPCLPLHQDFTALSQWCMFALPCCVLCALPGGAASCLYCHAACCVVHCVVCLLYTLLYTLLCSLLYGLLYGLPAVYYAVQLCAYAYVCKQSVAVFSHAQHADCLRVLLETLLVCWPCLWLSRSCVQQRPLLHNGCFNVVVDSADPCMRLTVEATSAGKLVGYVPGVCKAVKLVDLMVLTVLLVAFTPQTIIDVASRKLQPPPHICFLL